MGDWATTKQYRAKEPVWAWQFLGKGEPLAEDWRFDSPDEGPPFVIWYMPTGEAVAVRPGDWVVSSGDGFDAMGNFEFRLAYEETEQL